MQFGPGAGEASVTEVGSGASGRQDQRLPFLKSAAKVLAIADMTG